MTTWVLVANAAEANLYKTSNLRIDNLHLVKGYNHPDSRKKISELVTDKPGHYDADASGGGGSFEKGNPKKVAAEQFALELVKELKANCSPQETQMLVFVMQNSFYKFVSKHFDAKPYKASKIIHVAKDYTKHTLPDLNEVVKEHLLAI